MSSSEVERVSFESALYQIVCSGTYHIADHAANQERLVLREGYRVEVRDGPEAAGNQGHKDLHVRVLVILSETFFLQQLDNIS